MRGIDISTGADPHLAEFTAAFGIRLNAALAGENPVSQGLQAVASNSGLGIECGDLLAGPGNLELLLADLTLVEGAGIGALLDLLRNLGDRALEVEVGAVRKMGIENTQVLHEGLIAAGLPGLTLE